jgi:SET domain-containing protein
MNNNFYLKDSLGGKGVFTNKKFKAGDFVLEFGGQLYQLEELPKPYNDVDDHYMQIDETLYLGPSGSFDDFINHSCDPNCGVKMVDGKVNLFSIKEICVGDELTWDYSTTMDEDNWEMNCLCGKNICRGKIRDFKYLPKKIQQKYINAGVVPDYILKKLQISI